MRKMLCAIALLFCVVSLTGSTSTVLADGGYSNRVRGTYQFNAVGVWRYNGSRESANSTGTLQISRTRVTGSSDWSDGEQTSFSLRLNQPVNDRKRRQRRVATGTFTLREGNRTTRGTGRVSFKLIKKANGAVLIKGTYVINYTNGRYAGARSVGRVTGRKD